MNTSRTLDNVTKVGGVTSQAAEDERERSQGERGIDAGTGAAVAAAVRLLDIALTSVALVVLFPLMFVIAVAIRIDSPGPALFRQRRLGLDMQPITVLKFRTMWHGAGSEVHEQFVRDLLSGATPEKHIDMPRFKLSRDQRVTRVGRYLRSSSLDELPQLLNVLRGNMSLVGPRPAIEYETESYAPECFGRFAVKPGITGLWQVSGRSELSMSEMLRLDLEYVERRSLWLNSWIIFRTAPAVLSRRGAA